MRVSFLLFLLGALTFSKPRVYGQESLLLGEIKLEDICPEKRSDKTKKILIYGMKYKKNGKYKDSTLQAIQDYSQKGELINRTTFGGKKGERSYKKSYKYDERGNVISFVNMAQGGMGVEARTAEFNYDSKNQVIRQNISLANISYQYHSDGRLKTKSYYYNNGSESSTEPWVAYFIYDDSLNLVHVANDTASFTPTSFYNEKNELIRHDYYPGVAYSTYAYDSRGLCIEQVDYEISKNGWDSTKYNFQFDETKRLVVSATVDKKGRIRKDRSWNYNKDGTLVSEILYRKNKPKRFYTYNYTAFKE